MGDNQASEISLGETEYTCKKYVVGEAIKKLGELEDVLESWHIENLEELKTRLHDCQVYHLQNNSNETLIHNLKNELADLQHRLKVAEKALSKAVNDKCKAENIIAESIVGKGAKVAVPKKEQWYLEQSEKEIKGE